MQTELIIIRTEKSASWIVNSKLATSGRGHVVSASISSFRNAVYHELTLVREIDYFERVGAGTRYTNVNRTRTLCKFIPNKISKLYNYLNFRILASVEHIMRMNTPIDIHFWLAPTCK